MSSNGRHIFAIHRLAQPDADLPGDLAAAIGKALEAHRLHFGGDPAALLVSRATVERAREALARLGLPRLAVASNGGCLAWECWAMVASKRPASLLARVGAPVEVTPARARDMLAEAGQLPLDITWR